MELAAILISALALSLSVFTFYWTSIREVKRFYLIRVDRMAAMLTPEFALVNGGAKDILITAIECGFDNKDKNGCAYPAQRIEIDESDSLLLPAGKAFHCKVRFLEPFTSSFVLEGEKDTRIVPLVYQMEMRVDVAWIEQNGVNRKASAVISKYGFSEGGHITMHTPMAIKHDLYKTS